MVGESGATAQGDITQGIVEVSEDGKTDPDEKGQQEKIEGGKLKDKDKEEEKVVSESEETKPEKNLFLKVSYRRVRKWIYPILMTLCLSGTP